MGSTSVEGLVCIRMSLLVGVSLGPLGPWIVALLFLLALNCFVLVFGLI